MRPEPVEVPGGGRALVPIDPAAPAERPEHRMRRLNAAFLAQLIATRSQAPQTRARRRVGPAEAVAAYAIARDPATTPNGSTLTRSM